MTVSDVTAARHFPRPAPARLLLIGLYCTAAVTGAVLGDWPQWLLAPVLLGAAAHRAALTRRRTGALRRPARRHRPAGTPAGDGSRP